MTYDKPIFETREDGIVVCDYEHPLLKRYSSPLADRPKKEETSEMHDKGMHLSIDAHHWMINHENAFWFIYHFVKAMQAARIRGYIKERTIVYLLESHIDAGNEEYAVPINEWSGIIRYMMMVDPSLIDNPLKTYCSYIDYYGIYEVPYLEQYMRDQEVA